MASEPAKDNCDHWDIGDRYLMGAELNRMLLPLYVEVYALRERKCRLKCIYDTYVAYRYVVGGEVTHNCETKADCNPPPSPQAGVEPLKCVRRTGQLKDKLLDKDKKFEVLETSLMVEIDRLKAEIFRLEEDIAYEKEQRGNLTEKREAYGITQRDIDFLYPEADEVITTYAPDSDVAIDIEDKTPWNWLYAGGGLVGVGLLFWFISSKLED